MKNIRIGVLCPSEIAFRRFVPSLKECEEFTYVGVASASFDEWAETVPDQNAISSIMEGDRKKAENFKNEYGGKIFESYSALIKSDEIDAVYIPLPPALHYKWGKLALLNNKHLFMEKPFTDDIKKSQELIEFANKCNLAVHENYMFIYHSQIEYIKNRLNDIGELRSIRGAFTFPMRQANDFRYNKALGGGALLDCAGYPVKLMSMLLDDNAKIDTAKLRYIDGYEVDFYGSATLSDSKNTAQIIFGMDNSYKCELELQGSKGCIFTGRIFTAPDNFTPEVTVTVGNEKETVMLEKDSSFKKSIERFYLSIYNKEKRQDIFNQIIKQGRLISEIKEIG